MMDLKREGRFSSACILLATFIYLASHYSFIFLKTNLSLELGKDCIDGFNRLYNQLQGLSIILVTIVLTMTFINLLVIMVVTIKEYICFKVKKHGINAVHFYTYDLKDFTLNLIPIFCTALYFGGIYLTTI